MPGRVAFVSNVTFHHLSVCQTGDVRVILSAPTVGHVVCRKKKKKPGVLPPEQEQQPLSRKQKGVNAKRDGKETKSKGLAG